MKKLILISLILLSACSISPRMIFQSIAQGRLDQAVSQIADMLNEHDQISAKDLDKVLETLSNNKRFNLDLADELLDRLKPESRRVVMGWYIQVYLKASEQALDREEFESARAIWKRNQRVREQVFPDFEESTPVLGVIDLREAAYCLRHQQRPRAKTLFASARQKLSSQKPFDRVKQYNFRQLVAELSQNLK